MQFVKPKEKLRVTSNDQGLRADNSVFIKGNKRSVAESLAMLQNSDDSDDNDSFFRAASFHTKKKNKQHKSAKKKKHKPKRTKKKKSSKTSRFYHDSPQIHHRRASMVQPASPLRTRKAPLVGDSTDEEDHVDDFSDELLSDGDISDLNDISFSGDDDLNDNDLLSEFSSVSSLRKGKKGMGPRKIDIDDSMSIISDTTSKPGKGSKPPSANMFSGLSKKEAEEAEKNDLLARFHILKQRGTHLSKNFSNKSSLNEMRMEMGRIEHEARVERSVQMNRRWFLAGTSALSRATDNYAPKMVKGKWHGFDKYVLNSIHDYDEPFERLSEHYGGVVSAITGGNPLWEIVVLFAYQFFVYGFMTDGASQATANENMTIDDIQQRYPYLIKEAVEKELNRRKEEEDMKLRQSQFEQRAQFNAFDAQQHMAAAAHQNRPDPNTFIRPPSSQFTQFYPPAPPQMQQQQAQHQQSQRQYHQPRPQQQSNITGSPPTLNAENPVISENPTMNQHVPQPQQQRHPMTPQFDDIESQRVQMPPQITIMHTNPFLFNEMHAALPHVDHRPIAVQEHGTESIEIIEDGDDIDIDDYEFDEILDNPLSTRQGRPHSLNQAPPNKRDSREEATEQVEPSQIPLPISPPLHQSYKSNTSKKPPFSSVVSPEQIKANRENGYVININ